MSLPGSTAPALLADLDPLSTPDTAATLPDTPSSAKSAPRKTKRKPISVSQSSVSTSTPKDSSSASFPSLTTSKAPASGSLFYTPPVDPSRQAWLSENAEQESYGLISPNSSSATAAPSTESVSKTSFISAIDAVADNDAALGSQQSTDSYREPPSATAISEKTSDLDIEYSLTNKSNMAAAKAASALPSALSHNIDKFVSSLKEPRYRTPLHPSSVSLLYQTFYDEFFSQADRYLIQSTANVGSIASGNGSDSGNNTSATQTPGSVANPLDGSTQFSGGLYFRKREIRMETYEEIAEKKRERALRPVRLKEYSETAEARATTLIYDRLFRPKVGDDLQRNEELSQRIKALRELPLTPQLLDCGIELVEDEEAESKEESKSKVLKISESKFVHLLEPVAAKFSEMEEQHTPAGKLNAFLEGHRMIVEDVINSLYPPPPAPVTKPRASQSSLSLSSIQSTLENTLNNSIINRKRSNSGIGTNFLKRHSVSLSTSSQTSSHTSSQPHDATRRSRSSSQTSNSEPIDEPKKRTASKQVAADQLLPLLIYIFVHFDIPNLWLQLSFIMRYRNQSITALGEVAYCLTNWQAVIAFIEKTTLFSLGLDAEYRDLIEQVEKESSNEEKNDDDDIIEKDPLVLLVKESPFSTDFDIFTDSPSSIPLTQHNSIRAHLRQTKLAQLAASSINNFNNNSNSSATSSTEGSGESGPLGGGPFALMDNGAGRRASTILTTPNDLVLSADQSIKSLGNTFGNSYRFLMSKINAPKDQQNDVFQDGQSQSEGVGFSPATSGMLPTTRPKSSSLSSSHNVNLINGDEVASPSHLAGSPVASPSLVPRRSSSSSVSSLAAASLQSAPMNVSSSTSAASGTSLGSLNDSSNPTAIESHNHNEPLLGRLVRSLRSNNDTRSMSGTATPNAASAQQAGFQYSALGSELSTMPTDPNETGISPIIAGSLNIQNLPTLGSVPKIAPPSDPTLLAKEWTDLTVKDIEKLHTDYIRLVEYMKTINAFY